MNSTAYGAWMRTGWDAWLLGAEASVVVGLRLARIAGGGKAGADEARLMVTEKMAATLELQAKAISGQLGASPLSGTRRTLKYYQRKVSANRRRLTR